jgi:hypothetical protein
VSGLSPIRLANEGHDVTIQLFRSYHEQNGWVIFQ